MNRQKGSEETSRTLFNVEYYKKLAMELLSTDYRACRAQLKEIEQQSARSESDIKAYSSLISALESLKFIRLKIIGEKECEDVSEAIDNLTRHQAELEKKIGLHL
jgi:predicted  nucleic acid-binding Zn-ribbon protein